MKSQELEHVVIQPIRAVLSMDTTRHCVVALSIVWSKVCMASRLECCLVVEPLELAFPSAACVHVKGCKEERRTSCSRCPNCP